MPSSRARRRAYAGSWWRVRRSILERDGYRCKIKGPKCTGKAKTVDHIVPLSAGGAWWDPSNLRAACEVCNYGHHGKQVNRWQNGRTHITLVVGPKGVDLLAGVRSEIRGDDLVIDGAALTRALGSAGAAAKARAQMIDQLEHGVRPERRAWITSDEAAAVSSLPHHKVVWVGGSGGGDAPPMPRPSREW